MNANKFSLVILISASFVFFNTEYFPFRKIPYLWKELCKSEMASKHFIPNFFLVFKYTTKKTSFTVVSWMTVGNPTMFHWNRMVALSYVKFIKMTCVPFIVKGNLDSDDLFYVFPFICVHSIKIIAKKYCILFEQNSHATNSIALENKYSKGRQQISNCWKTKLKRFRSVESCLICRFANISADP